MYRNDRLNLKQKVRPLADAGLRRWHRYCYEKEPPALHTAPHFLLRRKTLFTLAVVILLAGAAIRPLSFVFLLWGRRFIAVLVTGLLIGALLRQLTAICLGTKGRLWYTRRIAPFLVLALLVAIHTTLPIADQLVARMFRIGSFFSSAASVHALVAIELVTIALLR